MTNFQISIIIINLVFIEFTLSAIKSSIDELVDEIKKRNDKDVL